LARVQKEIHGVPDSVRYVMNGFVIAVGGYVAPLTTAALKVANAIGKVSVDMKGTSCKVPFAPDYIQKMIDKGVVGRKKKMARC
jgi:hypothetical protein